MTLLATVFLLAVFGILMGRAQMASALAPGSLTARLLVKQFINDPGATDPLLASPDGGTTPYYIDMARINKVLIMVAPTIAGGDVTLVRVMASSDVLGATNPTEVRTSGVLALDNLDGSANSGCDRYVTEVHAEEIRQLSEASGLDLRYLTIEITHATSTDESMVTIVAEGRDEYSGQTATVQA